MPIDNNDFGKFADTEDADRATLETIGLAVMQVAMPASPVDTGNLRRSHTHSVSGDHVDVGVTADYGGYVHNGTSRQKAQPWLKTAVQANTNAISGLGVKAWRDHVE